MFLFYFIFFKTMLKGVCMYIYIYTCLITLVVLTLKWIFFFGYKTFKREFTPIIIIKNQQFKVMWFFLLLLLYLLY